MANSYMVSYTLAAIVLSAIDFYFAAKTFRKDEKVGKALGWSAFFAGVITLAYLLSVNTETPWLISVASSLTFVGIDCMLTSLLYFVYLATRLYNTRGARFFMNATRLLALLDSVNLIANIRTGHVVGYAPQDPVGVSYLMKPLYVVHLMFSYFLVAAVLALLIYKCVKTPRQYRNQYMLLIASISVVVAVNAIFLFQQEGSFFTQVDCSIPVYSVGLFLMYWSAYDYRDNDMVKSLSVTIFENINQGIALFDYWDEMILHNQRAEALLKGVRFEKAMPVGDFLAACGIVPGEGSSYSVQCDLEDNVPLRCDYRLLTDDRGRPIGKLFVFTDLSRSADLTTGFEYARDGAYINAHSALFRDPAAVAVFDIIGLRDVNRVLGRDEGDRRIRALAKRMRRHMPQGTCFLRGYEANLIAICPRMTEAQIRPAVERVVADCDCRVMYGLSATTDGESRIASEREERTPVQVLEIAYRSLRIKKLLTAGSNRSQTLTSLVRALEEADSDTEAHVRRTQKMGAALGRRVGLSDAQLMELELLCLLHDIGKVGIPLEILNKPGQLTDREWEVLRTHAEKGYQIALSSDELKSIARMILCHHERWDGKGYPQGLAGASIPVLSRIIAVVDAYDAMVNDRSYRKAMPPEAAQAEIRRCAGTQFDPELARAFLQLLAEDEALAAGEKVSGAADRAPGAPVLRVERTGFATPIAYSRYLLDIDNVIIQVDERFEAITGYCAEEAVGHMTQAELIPPEDLADYLIQVGKQLAHGDIAYIRHEILRKDGTRAQVACCGRRFYDSAEKAHRNEIIVFQV